MRLSIIDRFDFDANFKKKESVDEEMLTPVESEPVVIKCHYYGASKYLRDKTGQMIVDAKCYLVPREIVDENNIAVGDFIDDQPIKIMDMYPIPSGRARKKQRFIYEIYTYK